MAVITRVADADLLQSVGERQRVDHGGQHAHVVGRDPIQLAARAGDAAEDIAAAHHHADLDAGRGHAGDLLRQAVDAIGIDAELAPPANTSPLNFSRMRL